MSTEFSFAGLKYHYAALQAEDKEAPWKHLLQASYTRQEANQCTSPNSRSLRLLCLSRARWFILPNG